MPDYPSGLVYDPEIRAMEAVAFTDYITGAVYDPDFVSMSTSICDCPECPEPPTPDVTPPVVSGFLPAPGTTLGINDPVQFDVTDTSGSVRAVIAAVSFTSSGAVELAYDGNAFMPRYRNSTVQVIANGYRFSLRRVGGWSGDSIDVKVIAVDPSGNLDE